MKGRSCDTSTLGAALAATCEKRNSVDAALRYSSVVAEMRGSGNLHRQWDLYVSKHSYAEGITLDSTLDAVEEAMYAAVQALSVRLRR